MTRTVFTTGQVGKMTKVAPRTVSKWFDSGRLKGYRIPGSQDRRIPREHLLTFLTEHGMPIPKELQEARIQILTVGVSRNTCEMMAADSNERVQFDHTSDFFEAGLLIDKENPPKVVILDCILGSEVVSRATRYIRSEAKLSEAVIIVLTGEDGAEKFDGATLTFKKPFDPAGLHDQLKIYTGDAA